MCRICVFDSRAPAPVPESMETGIDGLRRSVVRSHGREVFGVDFSIARRDGSADRVVFVDEDFMSRETLMSDLRFGEKRLTVVQSALEHCKLFNRASLHAEWPQTTR
jgi:hypothetical protein